MINQELTKLIELNRKGLFQRLKSIEQQRIENENDKITKRDEAASGTICGASTSKKAPQYDIYYCAKDLIQVLHETGGANGPHRTIQAQQKKLAKYPAGTIRILESRRKDVTGRVTTRRMQFLNREGISLYLKENTVPSRQWICEYFKIDYTPRDPLWKMRKGEGEDPLLYNTNMVLQWLYGRRKTTRALAKFVAIREVVEWVRGEFGKAGCTLIRERFEKVCEFHQLSGELRARPSDPGKITKPARQKDNRGPKSILLKKGQRPQWLRKNKILKELLEVVTEFKSVEPENTELDVIVVEVEY